MNCWFILRRPKTDTLLFFTWKIISETLLSKQETSLPHHLHTALIVERCKWWRHHLDKFVNFSFAYYVETITSSVKSIWTACWNIKFNLSNKSTKQNYNPITKLGIYQIQTVHFVQTVQSLSVSGLHSLH